MSASWYQVWLEYDKHLQIYLRSFTKNNTNMLSRTQGKPWMATSWKLVQKWVNYQTSNLLWFERNQAKDDKDTAKNQWCVIIKWSRITNKMPLLTDKPFSRINWKLKCGWINQLWRALQWLKRIEFQSSELQCENQLCVISVRSRYSNSAVTL